MSLTAFELELLEDAFPDQSYRPTTASREAYFSRLMARYGGGTVTSRWRSFARQNELVLAGRSKAWLSQHCFGYAFDFVPARTTISIIRRAARTAHMHVLDERDHIHLYVIDEVTWARFKSNVRLWLNQPYHARVFPSIKQGLP